MCIITRSDDILRQLEHCKDPDKKRKLLEEIDRCRSCIEQTDSLKCKCRLSFQEKLQNFNYTFAHQQKIR
jgi:hypothetical protein